MTTSIIIRALGGGILIGLAAALLLVANGRIAGVSGIVGRIATSSDRGWRFAFLGGLVGGGFVLALVSPQVFGTPVASLGQLAIAGALVGVGTQLANGCTSGHGVCGIGRGSFRSIVATLVFMAAGAVAVLV